MTPFWLRRLLPRSAARLAAQAQVQGDVPWLDGERVEEAMAKKASADGCWLCVGAAESDSLPSGGVALHVTVCTEHVQLAARRALVRQLAKMSDTVRERLEQP